MWSHLLHYPTSPGLVQAYLDMYMIAGKIFNNREVVDEMDMDCGIQNMKCSCSSSEYCYKPCGHVITGNLNVIKDGKLRKLIKKGPTYREQNNIDWERIAGKQFLGIPKSGQGMRM